MDEDQILDDELLEEDDDIDICDCGECQECIESMGECTCGDCDVCLEEEETEDDEEELFDDVDPEDLL